MKKLLYAAFYTVLGASATFAQQYAPVVIGGSSQDQGNVGKGLLNVVNTFKQISTAVYSSLFIVALILFFVGMMMSMIQGRTDPAKKIEGYKFMGFGILALFVMVGIWGIIGFISQNTGVGVGGDIPTPGVPTNVRVY